MCLVERQGSRVIGTVVIAEKADIRNIVAVVVKFFVLRGDVPIKPSDYSKVIMSKCLSSAASSG